MIITAHDYIIYTLGIAKICREVRAKEGKPPLVVYSQEEEKRCIDLWEKGEMTYEHKGNL